MSGGWRKSTRSTPGSNCVEVACGWRKASYSVNNGQCAEVGNGPAGVLVRDTTDRDGVTLAVSPGAWRAFTARLREACT